MTDPVRTDAALGSSLLKTMWGGGAAAMGTDSWGEVDRGRLDDVCRRYGLSSLLVFGSVARGESTSSSDIDLLYELSPGVTLGWEIEDLSDELAQIFGRPVDLVARVALHPLLEEAVLGEARPLYAA